MLYIPPKEAKVFVTKTKAPYLIAIELFDPLEVVEEPLVLEPYQPPAPAEPSRSLKKMKTLKRIMPAQDVLILGTVPLNLVDPRLVMEKSLSAHRHRHGMKYSQLTNKDEPITIAKYRKRARNSGNRKITPIASLHKLDVAAGPHHPIKKQGSAVFSFNQGKSEASPLDEEMKAGPSIVVPNTSMEQQRDSDLRENSRLDISLAPVLVEQTDVVLFDECTESRRRCSTTRRSEMRHRKRRPRRTRKRKSPSSLSKTYSASRLRTSATASGRPRPTAD
ncbi:MAG: hypothetical protein P4M11_08135 [Candidatus Pacebacteria bacterium]|nr:hypothetical protein [Candidatus Paceibacterota bacterium]